MDGFDRIYDLHRILKNRKTAISTQDILQEMECSRATFNRIKRHMTDFLGAPIAYSREQGGYYYQEDKDSGFELPGLWFNEKELFSLLLIQQLLNNLGTGFLKKEFSPITEKITKLLKSNQIDHSKIKERVRFLGVAMRDVEPGIFTKIVDATLNGTSIEIVYMSRDQGEQSERVISPQRIINYRNNWYLDAWCHKRESYRTFALDCIIGAHETTARYQEVDQQALDQYYQASYGIYAGNNVELAKVRFSKDVAYSVSREIWHPEQRGEFLEDGRYLLTLPVNIGQPHEFIQDVIRYFAHAEIVAPPILREKLHQAITETLALYQEES
ncbi:WYL domain-containing protein [Teredinibacter sp. KSP-S5-2]|uniref:helix-turn-helix transcriptional regulator n=1 Tax=Teredinibacter sp. KSP-S5-2 TaxID=3034506 RepID=UPI0029341AD4|nr:WYL domain-containing protein [Teredinibacter sp. KSP-S5-2]WNO10210.1 WYL domain-containing protein [Teredinibacter sp. KSP-S5-2]